jgi:type IV secretory pathway TraG/TraD family ATPase VirD4
MAPHSDITYLARVAHRNDNRVFGIRQNDRFYHMYVIGKTGTGKSHLLQSMAFQDATNGRGFAVFDPHGDMVSSLAEQIPKSRQADVVYLNAASDDLIWSFNPFANVAADERALVAAELIEVFKKIWPDDWGPRLEHLLRNVVFTLLEKEGSSLGDVPHLLTDRTFRSEMTRNLANEQVRIFWQEEFANYSPAFRAVVTAPLQNKVGALLTDPLLNRVFTGTENPIGIRAIMDSGRILLVNLDKGQIGEGPSSILGAFLVSHVALAGLRRSAQPPNARRDFVAYLDEFQTFATQSTVTMLSELRKYRVGLVLGHQHLAQLEPAVRDAVFGNVGTLICFRVGGPDAAFVARELSPTFSSDNLTSLPKHHIYLRLMIDAQPSAAFSAVTLSPLSVELTAAA